MRLCRRCGIEKVESEFTRNGKYRKNICRECTYNSELKRKQSPEYTERLAQYRKNRKQEFKQKILEFFGGKCAHCGLVAIPDVYDVHHINPDEKEFQIGTNMGISWVRMESELKKCILLCANCHRKIHAKEHYIV